MSYRKIRLDMSGPVATVTLADPATLNAASLEMVDELLDAFRRTAEPGSGVRAIILTGEGRAFCSGANLSDARALGSGGVEAPDVGAALESHYRPFTEALRASPAPVVVALNGVCAGIGCAFALAADLIVAAESASLILAFRRIGLVPDGGLTWLLPRIVGKARALEAMLLGDTIPAATAERWGLVNRVVPDADLTSAARDLAERLATGPASLRLMRHLVWDSLDNRLDEQLEAERRAQKEAGLTADFREGVQAFFEKRPTAFTGR